MKISGIIVLGTAILVDDLFIFNSILSLIKKKKKCANKKL